MKKKPLPVSGLVFTTVLFLFVLYPVHAQIPDPASWNLFINSTDNGLVSDTFRIQTFGDSQEDNWEYIRGGNTALADISTENKDDLGGSIALKLLPGSFVSFEPFSLSFYQNSYIRVFFGGSKLMKNENLSAKVYRGNEIKTASLSTVTSNYADCPYSATRIKDNPYALDLRAADPATNTQNGYYALQYAIACGEIPGYSLFEGNGNWNDTLRWSHLPAQRNRNALLTGEITLSSAIRCNEIFLNNGTLHITRRGKAVVNAMTLFSTDLLHASTDYSLTVDGELVVQDRITIRKTLPETGKWYFISFPFDVYSSGIDERFQQKDDTPNAGGNYLYVQVYNGEKRALHNAATGNWEVVPVLPVPSERPLFEKGKGYLIALDEKASERTLSFSSRPDDIPENFGKEDGIPVIASTGWAETGERHRGWYLCGNPLPRPLSLTELEQNESLDGSVYIYDGSGYKAYPIGSEYVLPPMSAFFVKASDNTELKIKEGSPQKNSVRIATSYPLPGISNEPVASSATSLIPGPSASITFQVTGNELYLSAFSQSGSIRILNWQGVTVWRRHIGPGRAYCFSLPMVPGLYVLEIQTKGKRIAKKIEVKR